jgi:hypothetical protein
MPRPAKVGSPPEEIRSQEQSAAEFDTRVAQDHRAGSLAVSEMMHGACSQSVQATPRSENFQGLATALDLNVVSASCMGSDLGCATAQISEFGGVRSGEHKLPPQPVGEKKSRDVAAYRRMEQQVEQETTKCTAGIQDDAQDCQVALGANGTGCDCSWQLSSIQTTACEGNQGPSTATADGDAGAQMASANPSVSHEAELAAEQQGSQRARGRMEEGTNIQSHLNAPRSSRQQLCVAQPTIASRDKALQWQPKQQALLAHASTQTPPRPEPKRKFPKKEGTPTPVARRRIDCSPVHTPGAFRAQMAAWSRSPTALRTAPSPGMLSQFLSSLLRYNDISASYGSDLLLSIGHG